MLVLRRNWRFFRSRNLGCGNQRVHGAGTEAFEVQTDKLKAKLLKNTDKFGSHFWLQHLVHFFRRNLNSNNVSMMPDPKLAKSELPKRIFAVFDHRKGFT